MELQELFLTIKETLLLNGFTKRASCVEEDRHSLWILGPELLTEKDKFGLDTITGYTLSVERVYHSNGASRDTSYVLEIIYWNRSSGKRLEKLKINYKLTAPTVIRKVNDFISTYKEKLKEGVK